MGGKPILKDELIEGSLVILSLDHKTHCHGPEKTSIGAKSCGNHAHNFINFFRRFFMGRI